MGSAASTVLPEFLDQDLVQALTGGAFELDTFNRLKQPDNGKISRTAFLTLCNRTDAYFLHEWPDEKRGSVSRDILSRIEEVSNGLTRLGLLTWSSSAMKKRQHHSNNKTVDSDARLLGLEHAKCVMVFVTRQLVEELNSDSLSSGSDRINGCAQELRTAMRVKQNDSSKFLAVLMDETMKMVPQWGSELISLFGMRPYIDATYTSFDCDGDDDRKHQTVKMLCTSIHETIIAAIGRPVLGFKEEINAAAGPAGAAAGGSSKIAAATVGAPPGSPLISSSPGSVRRGSSSRKRRTLPLNFGSSSKEFGGDSAAAAANAADAEPVQISLAALVVERHMLLGRGTFGVVYGGFYFGAPVAVKELGELTAAERADAEKEAKVLCQLQNHPHILRFVGINSCLLPFCIVTERADLSLAALLHERRFRDRRTIIRILRDVSAAVEHLHSRFVIHRDLKPRNVLLVMPGFNVKVSDFGLAKVKTISIGRRSLNESTTSSSDGAAGGSVKAVPPRELVGTPAYMAPEILDFDGSTPNYSAQSDVYAFGVLANEALTFAVPFEGLHLAQIARKVVDRKTRPDLFFASTQLVDSLQSSAGSSKFSSSAKPSTGAGAGAGAGASVAEDVDPVTRGCFEQVRDMIKVLWHDLPGKRLEMKQHNTTLSNVLNRLPEAAATTTEEASEDENEDGSDDAEIKMMANKFALRKPSDKFLALNVAAEALVDTVLQVRSPLSDKWTAAVVAYDSNDMKHYVRYQNGVLRGAAEWIPLMRQAYWRSDGTLVSPLRVGTNLPPATHFPPLDLPAGWEMRYHPHSHNFIYCEADAETKGLSLASSFSFDAVDGKTTAGISPNFSPNEAASSNNGGGNFSPLAAASAAAHDDNQQQQQQSGGGDGSAEQARPVAQKMNEIQRTAADCNMVDTKHLLIGGTSAADPTALVYCPTCHGSGSRKLKDEDEDTCGFEADEPDPDADADLNQSMRSNSSFGVGIAETPGKYATGSSKSPLPPSASRRPPKMLFSPQPTARSGRLLQRAATSSASSPANKCERCWGECYGTAFDLARWAVGKQRGGKVWAHSFAYDPATGKASYKYPNELEPAQMQLLLMLYKAQCAVQQQMKNFSEIIVAGTAMVAAVQVLQQHVEHSLYRPGEIKTMFKSVLVGSRGFYPKEPVIAMENSLFESLPPKELSGTLKLDRFPGGNRVVIGENLKWNFENEGEYYDGVVMDYGKNNTFVIASVNNTEVVEKDVRRKNMEVPKNMSYRIMNLMDKMIKLNGNRVLSVEADSPFAACGLEAGDTVVGIDNIPVSKGLDIAKRIEECSSSSSPQCNLRYSRHLVSTTDIIDALKRGEHLEVAKIFNATKGWLLHSQIKAIVNREYAESFRTLTSMPCYCGD